MSKVPIPDPAPGEVPDLAGMRHLTAARIALTTGGAPVATRAEQAFLLDHARARAAVWSTVDWDTVSRTLAAAGLHAMRVASAAHDRATYVRRPDLGRRLAEGVRIDASPADVGIVIADGLSATAVALNAAPLAAALAAHLGPCPCPIVCAERARVALGDPIGGALGVRVLVMLIGERPGLSASDSLGAYITYDPRPGTPDSRRNCISNIRAGGLPIAEAADQIVRLVRAMLAARLSGVALQPHLALAAPVEALSGPRSPSAG